LLTTNSAAVTAKIAAARSMLPESELCDGLTLIGAARYYFPFPRLLIF